MKQNHVNAYFVVGAESSGTRLMAQIMLMNGCAGSAEHEQTFDNEGAMPYAFVDYTPIVWRRSYPHGGTRPNLTECLERLEYHHYTPHVIVTMRDFNAMAQSQVGSKHVQTLDEAQDNIRLAYRQIFSVLDYHRSVPYYVVNFEALVAHPQFTLAGLANYFKIAPLTHPDITNENAKYL